MRACVAIREVWLAVTDIGATLISGNRGGWSAGGRRGGLAQVACVAYMGLWSISPPLTVDARYRLVGVGATLLWIVVEWVRRPGTFLKPSFPAMCAMWFIAYSFMVALLTEGWPDVVRNVDAYICLLFVIVHEAYRQRGELWRLRSAMWASLAICPVWLTLTLRAYRDTPNVSRLLVRSSEIGGQWLASGVGGYGLVYSVMVALPIVAFLSLFRMPSLRRRHRALALTNLILGLAVVLEAGYSIAVLLTAVGLAAVLVVRSTRGASRVLYVGMLGAGVLVLTPGGQALMDGPIAEGAGRLYERKVLDLVESARWEASIGTVDDRAERYVRSAVVFVQHPLAGALTFDDVGKHSAVLDRFAQYGVIGGVPFVCAVLGIPFGYLRLSRTRRVRSPVTGLVTAGVALAVAFPLLNTVFSGFGYMLFICLPTALTYVGRGTPPRRNSRVSAEPVGVGTELPP